MNESRKLFGGLQTDAKDVLFTEENINDKLMIKENQDMKKALHLLSCLIEM